MSAVVASHIAFDSEGKPRIGRSNHKVIHIVREHRRGQTPGMIQSDFPHLSLAEIHAALAYYYDNKTAIDGEIAAGDQLASEMRDESLRDPAVQSLLKRVGDVK